MHSRWYNVAVVALWLSTMAWLVGNKVLPSILVGDPPSYPAILEAQKNEPPVGWSIWWQEHRLGWAVSATSTLPEELTEVRSKVRFDKLPLREMSPEWLRGMLPADQLGGRLRLESDTVLDFDPLGRLSRFESSMDFPPWSAARGPPGPKQSLLKIRGTIDGPSLDLWFRVGDLTPYQWKLDVPRNALLQDSLSPQSRLPGLREGQSWTMQTYGPLRPPTSPTEILHARVEARMKLMWNTQTKNTWLVVYRGDPGSAPESGNSIRGKLWVCQEDGAILKQEWAILGSVLTFVRLADDEAAGLAKKLAASDEVRP